jgi:hypothetical protein
MEPTPTRGQHARVDDPRQVQMEPGALQRRGDDQEAMTTEAMTLEGLTLQFLAVVSARRHEWRRRRRRMPWRIFSG